ADESVRPDEAVARILRERANNPAENRVVNGTRAQFNETLCREVVDLRWTGQDSRTVEVTSVGRSDRIEFFASCGCESPGRVNDPHCDPHTERIIGEVAVACVEHIVLPFVRKKRIEDRTV